MTHGYTTAFAWPASFHGLAFVIAAILINAGEPGAPSSFEAGGYGPDATEADVPAVIH